MREADALERLRAHGVTNIPWGWTISKVKYLANYVNGYAFKPDEWGTIGKPIIRIQNLTDPLANPNRYEGDLGEAYEVETGDFLISWSASLGLHVWQGDPGWLNQHIFRVDLYEDRCSRHFFRWLATWFMEELDRDAHGSTMQHLTKDAFGGFPVLLPPRPTQEEIADFLDSETARLDALISEKQRLLNLLAEKRRAAIADFVMRGLSGDVPRHDSGIPWLGEIPAHWDTVRARFLFAESNLPVRPDDQMVTCFRDGEVTLRSNRREEGFTNAVLELGYQGIRAGQLVLHSMDAFAGAIGVSDSDGKCSPEYVICDPMTDRTDSYYYALLLREMALRNFIQASCPAVRERAPRIRFNDFKDFLLPVPPLDEQREIVVKASEYLTPIAALHAKATSTVTLLQERRSALISAAVTGQLVVEASHAG